MGVALSATQLRRELAKRGLSQAELANLAGVAPATVTHAVHGRPVTPATVARIARALLRVPVIDGVESLLGGPV